MSKVIMFVHGVWVTPACWTSFKSFFEARGYTFGSSWPYLDKPASELKKAIDPKFADVTIKDLVDHHASKIALLSEPPILIGHSFGGLIVQLLLDRGLGQAGVAIDAGPPKGVMPSWTAIKSALPLLLSWRGWTKLHTMSLKDFGATFANPSRAALLLIAGGEDRTSTPSMVEAMYQRHKKSPQPVAKLQFPGRSHRLIAAPGWEEVADGISAWLPAPGV